MFEPVSTDSWQHHLQSFTCTFQRLFFDVLLEVLDEWFGKPFICHARLGGCLSIWKSESLFALFKRKNFRIPSTLHPVINRVAPGFLVCLFVFPREFHLCFFSSTAVNPLISLRLTEKLKENYEKLLLLTVTIAGVPQPPCNILRTNGNYFL